MDEILLLQILRRLAMAAYEQGWADACADWQTQMQDHMHPIGDSKRDTEGLLTKIDPQNMLGLRKGDQ